MTSTVATPVAALDQLNLAFAERFNARDLDGLMALNAPDVVFVPAPGQPVQGESAVRGALEQFLGLALPITMTVRHVFRSGDTGLAIADWSITGTAPDGSDVALAGTTADVAVFDEQHGWRYAVDNPFGTA
ncbi:YybH family protein [Agromyces sp. NPDC058110]|uniref:YybH family protein n=1 Tax=Agromyces sp. NPDC058110 TaxID=3346345 RepID=UPI0036DC07EA